MSLRFPDGSRTHGGPYGSPDNLTKIPSPPPRGRGGRDRGGWNEGAAWNRRPARRDMDIVDKELNRYQPAFDHVQRYPEGYGGQPGGFGGGRGRGRGGRGGRGGGWDDNKFDRFIGAIEGLTGKGGGNVTNTFNPTFNPTNVNAGRDIRDTSIIGGGPNTAGRDITGAGGDVETGDGGGGNTVNTNPVITNPGGTNPGGTDPGGTDPGGTDPGGTDPGGTDPGGTDPGGTDPGETTPGKYDEFINRTYNELLGRDAGQEGLDWWSGDLDRGQTEQQVIDNIKRNPEYINREMAKDLASSMEGKTYGTPGNRNAAASLGNINEDSLDAWIGPGGGLTQSSDPTGKTYYEGVGDKSKAAELLYKPVATGDEAVVTGWPSDLSERDEAIYNLYTDVMGRNPDPSGLKYWTGAGGEGMSLADIEASFRGSAEAKLRDNVAGTSNFVSIDDYLAGKGTGGAASSVASPPPEVIPPDPSVSGKVDNFLSTSANSGVGDEAYRNMHITYAGGPEDQPSAEQHRINQKEMYDRIKHGGLSGPYKEPIEKPIIDNEAERRQKDPIATLYADLLGRAPDAEGAKYWSDQLSSGNQTYDQIADNIMRSEEYQQKNPPGSGRGRTPLPQPPTPGPGVQIGRPSPTPPPRENPNITPIMPTPGPGVQIGRPAPAAPPIRITPQTPPRVNPNPSPPQKPGPGIQIGRPAPGVGVIRTPKPAPVASPPPKPSDWLQEAYTSAGLGKVDAGGRDYWTGDLGKGQTKAQVIANIMRHKK